jgi:hypothetical protein
MTDIISDDRTLFEIPAENYAKFEAQLAKISRKAVKLLGSEYAFKPFVFSHEEREMSDGFKHRVYSVLLNAVAPTLGDWTFMARLDHSSDTGTIVRMVPDVGALPAQYRTAKSTTCDHCNQKRFRRDTFVVRNNETGEFKQIGSTCLKDFFDGQDPYKVAKLAELLGYAVECGHGAEHCVGTDLRWVSVEDYLGHVAATIRTCGWVSGKTAYETGKTATRSIAWDSYMRADQVTEADRAIAEEAVEWAISLRAKDTLNDYEHNILVVAEASMIETRSLGLAASIVGVHINNKLRTQQVQKQVDVGSFDGVIELFKTAGKNLPYPKIWLKVEGKPIMLAVAGANSKAPGTINITDGRPFGQNTWYGRVTPQGVWERSQQAQGSMMTSLTAFLAELSTTPAETASKYGKLTGNCMFCRKPLTDGRSTEVGYGKKCASNYALPY